MYAERTVSLIQKQIALCTGNRQAVDVFYWKGGITLYKSLNESVVTNKVFHTRLSGRMDLLCIKAWIQLW